MGTPSTPDETQAPDAYWRDHAKAEKIRLDAYWRDHADTLEEPFRSQLLYALDLFTERRLETTPDE